MDSPKKRGTAGGKYTADTSPAIIREFLPAKDFRHRRIAPEKQQDQFRQNSQEEVVE